MNRQTIQKILVAFNACNILTNEEGVVAMLVVLDEVLEHSQTNSLKLDDMVDLKEKIEETVNSIEPKRTFYSLSDALNYGSDPFKQFKLELRNIREKPLPRPATCSGNILDDEDEIEEYKNLEHPTDGQSDEDVISTGFTDIENERRKSGLLSKKPFVSRKIGPNLASCDFRELTMDEKSQTSCPYSMNGTFGMSEFEVMIWFMFKKGLFSRSFTKPIPTAEIKNLIVVNGYEMEFGELLGNGWVNSVDDGYVLTQAALRRLHEKGFAKIEKGGE